MTPIEQNKEELFEDLLKIARMGKLAVQAFFYKSWNEHNTKNPQPNQTVKGPQIRKR